MYSSFFFSCFILSLHADFTFLYIGDWGGQGKIEPYTCSAQQETNVGMNKIAGQHNVDTILANGDNFYSYGITKDTADVRFRDTFENVYTGEHLQGVTFYPTLGNHDHRGDIQYQIRTDIERWYLPTQWYEFSKRFQVDGKRFTVEFVMIDTVELAGESYVDEYTLQEVRPTGPLNLTKARSQWTFIEHQLQSSVADYLFVVGHYPVWSVCRHGPTDELIDYLEPLLEKYHVTAYIAGHDHCMDYIDPGRGVVYPLNGAGSRLNYDASKVKIVRKELGRDAIKYYLDRKKDSYGRSSEDIDAGFGSVTLGSSHALFRHYDQAGNLLFEADPVPIRPMFLRDPASTRSEDVTDLGIFFVAGCGVGACLFGFLVTYFLCKPKNDLKHAIDLEEHNYYVSAHA